MNEASLAIICEKGSTELPQNYRPIALLNMAYKILAIIILKRIVPHIDDRIGKSLLRDPLRNHYSFLEKYKKSRKKLDLKPTFLYQAGKKHLTKSIKPSS